jgi:FKBP-type peptidyl-prolyl cis-trans isomerase
MKKSFIACAAAAVVIGLASCSEKNASADSTEDAAFIDSLATINGAAMGTHYATFLNNPDAPKKFNKSDVMRGIRDVMKCDTADLSYFIGLQMGMEAFQTYMSISSVVKGVDRQKMVEAIQKAVMADSVEVDLMQLRQEAGQLNQRLQEISVKKEEDAKINSEEGVKNRQEGEKFMKGLTGVERTDNGIAYKVTTPGTGKAVDKNARAIIKYNVTKINGDTVSGTGNEARNVFIQGAPLKGMIQALQMMKEGETATFYLPWELAYGANGLPARNVGPCETVAVEITVTEVPEDK